MGPHPDGDASPPRPIRAWVVANPAAGQAGRTRELQAVAGVFAQAGWTVRWRWSRGPGDAERLAAEAASAGADVVVAAGGDGTVNEAANGLVHTECALAPLPGGTGNVLAAQLGLVGLPTPLHRPRLALAAEMLARGNPKPVDVGRARVAGSPDRYFVLWAGIGLDAEIVRRVEMDAKGLKRSVGPAAFAAHGLASLLQTSGAEAVVQCDKQRFRAPLLMAVVANVPLYAGSVRLAPGARMDDGRLDVTMFVGEGAPDTIRHILGVAIGLGRPDVAPAAARARRVRVVANRPLPVHLDAEPFGYTPAEIEVVEGALRLWIPDRAPAGFLTRREQDEP